MYLKDLDICRFGYLWGPQTNLPQIMRGKHIFKDFLTFWGMGPCHNILWKSENNLQGVVLSLYHEGSRDPTQVIVIVRKHLYLLAPFLYI